MKYFNRCIRLVLKYAHLQSELVAGRMINSNDYTQTCINSRECFMNNSLACTLSALRRACFSELAKGFLWLQFTLGKIVEKGEQLDVLGTFCCLLICFPLFVLAVECLLRFFGSNYYFQLYIGYVVVKVLQTCIFPKKEPESIPWFPQENRTNMDEDGVQMNSPQLEVLQLMPRQIELPSLACNLVRDPECVLCLPLKADVEIKLDKEQIKAPCSVTQPVLKQCDFPNTNGNQVEDPGLPLHFIPDPSVRNSLDNKVVTFPPGDSRLFSQRELDQPTEKTSKIKENHPCILSPVNKDDSMNKNTVNVRAVTAGIKGHAWASNLTTQDFYDALNEAKKYLLGCGSEMSSEKLSISDTVLWNEQAAHTQKPCVGEVLNSCCFEVPKQIVKTFTPHFTDSQWKCEGRSAVIIENNPNMERSVSREPHLAESFKERITDLGKAVSCYQTECLDGADRILSIFRKCDEEQAHMSALSAQVECIKKTRRREMQLKHIREARDRSPLLCRDECRFDFESTYRDSHEEALTQAGSQYTELGTIFNSFHTLERDRQAAIQKSKSEIPKPHKIARLVELYNSGRNMKTVSPKLEKIITAYRDIIAYDTSLLFKVELLFTKLRRQMQVYQTECEDYLNASGNREKEEDPVYRSGLHKQWKAIHRRLNRQPCVEKP